MGSVQRFQLRTGLDRLGAGAQGRAAPRVRELDREAVGDAP